MAASSSHAATRSLLNTSSSFLSSSSQPSILTSSTAAGVTASASTKAACTREIPIAFATRRSSRACVVPRPTRGSCSPSGGRVHNPSYTRRNYSRRSSIVRRGGIIGAGSSSLFDVYSYYENNGITNSSVHSADNRDNRGSSEGRTNHKMKYSTSSTALPATNSNHDPDHDYNKDMHEISSSRGRNAVSLLPVYLTDARAVTKYDPIHAPDGALQLSVAENQMIEDLLVPAIRKFATTTTTSSNDGDSNDSENEDNNSVEGLFHSNHIYYQPTHGRQSLRETMANYLQRILKFDSNQKLDIDGMVLGAGCNAVLENLCFCLTEPGDAVLLPTPYYAAFEFDLVARAGLNIVPVHTMKYNTNGNDGRAFSATEKSIPQSAYYPNTKSLNAAYEQAKASGSEPKVLLLSHPNNPLGVCYPKQVVEECIDWAREKKVHLISDEIYAGSVYRKTNPLSGEDTFHSALTIASNIGSKEDSGTHGLGLGPYIHFVYALSKDFALSGLRVGVAYSENKAIRLPMQKLNDLCQISSQTQQTVEQMLSSGEEGRNWAIDEFLPRNNDRIKQRSDRVQLCLDECDIPCLFGDSGLFLWMDLSEFLPPLSDSTSVLTEEESEESKDARERELYLELLQEYGLLFTPGRSMRNEFPGFFRIVFTAASDHEFELGLERIQSYVKAKRGS